MIRAALIAAFLALPLPASAENAALPADPLGSPMWAYHGERLFAGQPVRFDARVKIELPLVAEDQRAFPVTIDARALDDVTRIVLYADLNPIPVAVDYAPLAARAFLATRIKLDQRTPVRAAVLTRDGTWHLAGDWVDAAGGGCSTPPVSRVRGDWADHLGEPRGGAWEEKPGTTDEGVRLRLSVRHPMDTGLVENIPAYAIDSLTVSDPDGRPLAAMKIWGSVAEDPAFTLIVEPAGDTLLVSARDMAGLSFEGSVTVGGVMP